MATDEMFDFAELECVDTAVRPILHPNTGDEIPGATIEIYGPESQFYKDAQNRLRTRGLNFSNRNRGAKPEALQKEFDRIERDRVISCIKSINGFMYKGQVISDPADACAKFEWLYKQAESEMSTLTNFIKSSSAK